MARVCPQRGRPGENDTSARPTADSRVAGARRYLVEMGRWESGHAVVRSSGGGRMGEDDAGATNSRGARGGGGAGAPRRMQRGRGGGGERGGRGGAPRRGA